MATTHANRIKELRDLKGWSQWELSVECGIPEGTIRRLEAGLMLPRLANAQLIARALGVTVTELFPESEEASA